jgi:hypothetical protein
LRVLGDGRSKGRADKGKAMTDRELLEKAAKAAGIRVHAAGQAARDGGGHGHVGLWTTTATRWNPLIDDGDALRLAVKLRLEVDIHHTGIAVRTPDGSKFLLSAKDEPDSCAATRRAIVRAAAAMAPQESPEAKA